MHIHTLCHKKQSQFNNENIAFTVISDFEKYGLSTLHAGPNFVKAILKIASQIEIRQHRCAGKQNKLKKDVRKKKNAEKLLRQQKLHLRITTTK